MPPLKEGDAYTVFEPIKPAKPQDSLNAFYGAGDKDSVYKGLKFPDVSGREVMRGIREFPKSK